MKQLGRCVFHPERKVVEGRQVQQEIAIKLENQRLLMKIYYLILKNRLLEIIETLGIYTE